MTILTLNKLLTNVAAHNITTGAIAFSESSDILQSISQIQESDRTSDILRQILSPLYPGVVSTFENVEFGDGSVTGEFYDYSEPGFTESFKFFISPEYIEFSHLGAITPPEFEELDFTARKGLGEGKKCKPGSKPCVNPATGYRYCIPEGWKCASERSKVPKQKKAKPTLEQAQQIKDLIQQGTRRTKAKYAVGDVNAEGKGKSTVKEKRSLLEGKVSEGVRSSKGKAQSARLPSDKSLEIPKDRSSLEQTEDLARDVWDNLTPENRRDLLLQGNSGLKLLERKEISNLNYDSLRQKYPDVKDRAIFIDLLLKKDQLINTEVKEDIKRPVRKSSQDILSERYKDVSDQDIRKEIDQLRRRASKLSSSGMDQMNGMGKRSTQKATSQFGAQNLYRQAWELEELLDSRKSKPINTTPDYRTKLKTLSTKLKEIYDDPSTQLDADGDQLMRDRAYTAAFDTFGIKDASVAGAKGNKTLAKIDLLKSKLGELGITDVDYLTQVRKMTGAKSQNISDNKSEIKRDKKDMQTHTGSERVNPNAIAGKKKVLAVFKRGRKNPEYKKEFLDEHKVTLERYIDSGMFQYIDLGAGNYQDLVDKYGENKAKQILNQKMKYFTKDRIEEFKVQDAINLEKEAILNGKNELLKHEYAAFQRIHPDKRGSITLGEFKKENNIRKTVEEYQKETYLDQALTYENIMLRGKDLSADIEKKINSTDDQKEHERIFATFRQNLLNSGISKQKADKIVENKKFDLSEEFLNSTKEAIGEFLQITQGMGEKTLKNIIRTDIRAFADKAGNLNIGFGGFKDAIFHEMGHHLEFSDKRIEKAAQEWRERRAKTDKPVQLNKIVNGMYGDDELAFPGKYISPYVGKYYKNDSTEVVSMGIQHFDDHKAMLELYKKDKSHFHFILGILRP